MVIRKPLSKVRLSQVLSMALGSWVPSKTNTMPLRPKENTCHTQLDTMFSLETEGASWRFPMVLTRPAVTTAMTPLAPRGSAARNTMKGVNTSNNTWKVVLSRPIWRTPLEMMLVRAPSTKPTRMPPKKLTRKAIPASTRENAP